MYSIEVMDYVLCASEKVYGDEIPIFAAIAVEDEIVSTAYNEVEKRNIPWAHAEFLAIEKACSVLDSKYLDSASLYVNLEPCAFCSAALEKVRIKNIFFGAYDPKCGAITHNIRLFDSSLIKPNILGGIQEERCYKVIRTFFEKLRERE
ncbi:MAG: nucleoside deaminase [Holosporales bacterium]|jgi:tRNA(adenine34) deaminase|nr:nucleoside deaminase [Holosporales bacterium]